MSNINLLAVGAAALSSFLVGGLWYSPVLFGNVWNKEAGNVGKPGQGHPAKVFGLSFVFALAAAFAYAGLVPLQPTAMTGAIQGAGIGAGIVAASFGINYQFANRSGAMWLIDGGYHTVQFALYGLILAVWRA
jgi:uncharacterized protein DUF1761